MVLVRSLQTHKTLTSNTQNNRGKQLLLPQTDRFNLKSCMLRVIYFFGRKDFPRAVARRKSRNQKNNKQRDTQGFSTFDVYEFWKSK